MPAELPHGLEKYSETPVFTETTVPAKLKSRHNTKPGVWGKLQVFEGVLDYVISGQPSSREKIEAGNFGVIEPEIVHWLEISGPVSFKVEFYKKAENGNNG